MYSGIDTEQELIANYYMGLAIDKAYRCSSYFGVGCVMTSRNNRFIVSGSQRAGEDRHIISRLYDRVNETNFILYLTQEPYLLNETAENELLQILSEQSIRQICVANLAPGQYEGRWCQTFKSYGVSTISGIGLDSLGLLAQVGHRTLQQSKPWISCALFLDDQDKVVSWKTFSEDFGFKADLGNLIANHSGLLIINRETGLETFCNQHYMDSVLSDRRAPRIIELQDEKLDPSLFDRLRSMVSEPETSAFLTTALKNTFLKLEALGLLDELVIYKSERYWSESLPYKVSLLSNGQKTWHLHDCSPLGDCLRYIYRAVEIPQYTAAH